MRSAQRAAETVLAELALDPRPGDAVDNRRDLRGGARPEDQLEPDKFVPAGACQHVEELARHLLDRRRIVA